MIPTAKEFLRLYYIYEPDYVYASNDDKFPLENLMEEYATEKAQYYVKEALKQAITAIKEDLQSQVEWMNENSILNAYPLNNIK